MLISSPDVEAKEDAIADPEMITINQLMESIDDYESWSKILIKELFMGRKSILSRENRG